MAPGGQFSEPLPSETLYLVSKAFAIQICSLSRKSELYRNVKIFGKYPATIYCEEHQGHTGNLASDNT